MKNTYLIYILISILFTSCTIAQIEKASTTSNSDSTDLSGKPLAVQDIKSENNLKWHSMVTNVPQDISNFSTSAFDADKIPLFAILAAGTGALMVIDEESWQNNRRLFNQSESFHELSDIGVAFGDEKYHFILAGAFGAFGLISNDKRSLKTASNIVEAIVASGLSVQVLKRIFGRESPAVATSSGGQWNFFPNLKDYQEHQPKYYAYPSGHITTLTATITVLANNYPEEKWIKPVGYSLVAICGIGLVSRGMHWYSDLPIGFFLGYTFGNIISPQQDHLPDRETGISSVKFHITPVFSFENFGVGLSLKF